MATELSKSRYRSLFAQCPKKYPEMVQEVQTKVLQDGKPAIEEAIATVKWFIKQKLPARDKLYALYLLRDVMLIPSSGYIHEYFSAKILDRLRKIALYGSSEPNEQLRGESCLDEFYFNPSAENRKYSYMFYRLLLECWQNWLEFFGDKNRKIKAAGEKIRPLFPKEQIYYDAAKSGLVQKNQQNSSRIIDASPANADPHDPAKQFTFDSV